jgi:beta-glucosidase
VYQEGAMKTRLQSPFIYGIDAVHGHSNVYGAVVFPQNIGLGAANDTALMYDMGAAVAEEMKLTHTLWNFSPCVAVAQDPRWGRVYESYSSDPSIVSSLAQAYLKGQTEHGILSTAKHYAGDGGTVFGTGEGENLIDRGDTQLTEAEFRVLHLAPYKALVDSGVKVIMASFSSINGTKMSEDKYYLTNVLKDEFGFKGFIVSDWEATAGLSGKSFKENVAKAVNAGVDMLMEPYKYAQARKAIIDGVNDGTISADRVNDAVSRILTVKFDMGLFEDPYMKNLTTEVDTLGSTKYRAIAKKLVSESMVLLKNKGKLLPLKAGQKIYVTGPAINDIGVQCGGWTKTWQGITDAQNGGKITEGTTILEGLQEYAAANSLEIITDPAHASEADIVILAVGEIPYAEYKGDSADISLTGATGLSGNSDAIAKVKSLNKPTVTLVVAGRQVMLNKYIGDWDAVVMCYLPGSEGEGVASVLTGETKFSGKLPMPWYKDVNQIGTGTSDLLFAEGYGLTY